MYLISWQKMGLLVVFECFEWWSKSFLVYRVYDCMFVRYNLLWCQLRLRPLFYEIILFRAKVEVPKAGIPQKTWSTC